MQNITPLRDIWKEPENNSNAKEMAKTKKVPWPQSILNFFFQRLKKTKRTFFKNFYILDFS